MKMVYHQRIAVVCPYCSKTNVDRLKRQYNECGQVEDLFECHECSAFFQQLITRWYLKLGCSIIPPDSQPKVWIHLSGDKYDGQVDDIHADAGEGYIDGKKGFRELNFG